MSFSFHTILLVEDDPITILVCEKIINLCNFAQLVVVAKNGKEGIDYLQEAIENRKPLPEIIFLDLNMPVLDGWQFLDAFSTLQFPAQQKPIIYILSSTIDPYDEERAMNYPVVKKFITKPLNKQILDEIKAETGH
jgi:CheY-like chemotaxis protein